MKLALHPLCGTTVRNWVGVLTRHGQRGMNWRRAVQITALAAAAAPVCWYERLRWGRSLSRLDVHEPIFICGHWQSGHTLAQLLLACDPRFATLRLRQAVQPAACLTLRPLLARLLRNRLPENRISDELPIGLDAPQGDDFALAMLSDVSFYYAWYFPEQADSVFHRSVLMEDLPAAALAAWQRHYRRLLQKLLCDSGRERVAVRNGANTARIRQLLAAFPDARFVFCHRDPYEVFSASLQRWQRMVAVLALDSAMVPEDLVEELTLKWYELLLQRYLEDRSQIPAGQLVEVAYSELRAVPLEAMMKVYDRLSLDGFETARPEMQRLLDSHPWELAGSRPLTAEQRAAVAQRWEFAFQEWGYSV